jgi:hypothetical protein
MLAFLIDLSPVPSVVAAVGADTVGRITDDGIELEFSSCRKVRGLLTGDNTLIQVKIIPVVQKKTETALQGRTVHT